MKLVYAPSHWYWYRGFAMPGMSIQASEVFASGTFLINLAALGHSSVYSHLARNPRLESLDGKVSKR